MALGPTWDFARRSDGNGVVDATLLDAQAWRSLQTTYRIGELLMPCCDTAAVPKLSANGNPFFAHVGNGCQTSPESQWHLRAKQLVRDTAHALGFHAELEHQGNTRGLSWCADVWIKTRTDPVVVELQHSYQHLRDYIARQKRYENSGHRCLWLVIPERYSTLANAMCKQRLREDFPDVKHWPEGQGACVRAFPVAALRLDPEAVVLGPSLNATTTQVLSAFIEGRLCWRDGAWRIDDH